MATRGFTRRPGRTARQVPPGQSVTAGAAVVTTPAASRCWWVYLLACSDGRTYAGIAIDVQARFRAHQCGKGAKFTRANPPLAILGMRAFPTRSRALQAEHALKQLSPAQKLAWAVATASS